MALDELMDEHEKGERVRAWLRENGSAIVVGVGLGLGAIFGWQWWKGNQFEHRVTAAEQFQALNDAVERKDADLVATLAGELAKNYADTPYAALASLQLADQKLAAGDKAGAVAALQQAASLTQDKALVALTELRRARVMLSDGKAKEALAVIEAQPDDLYVGLAAELRGDALLVLERTDEAKAAYQDALTHLETGAPNRRIVEMKLADLGGAPEPSEA